MYIEKELHNGYNAYLTNPGDDAGTGLDVGLLILEPGERYACHEPEKEVAALLFTGRVVYAWADERREATRKDCFSGNPSCLHVPRDTAFVVEAITHAEVYVQMAYNERAFAPKFYAPEDTLVQHAGAKGELRGCMRREIKTLFDYENAPYSNMVVGEVLNFPGKWSSYPPHHHPQPEVYFHRFDRPQGFGASFADGEVYTSRQNGLTIIHHGFHSQVAAPGYAMCYVWGIRHLPGNPWEKTRIDDEPHKWLLEGDVNQHIFSLEGE